jgi:hypothetical protein
MDNVLEMSVRRAYPDFFATKPGSLVWTPTIAAGDGWYPILISLFVALRELAAYSGATFTGDQLKEKFGHLRVYFSTHNTEDADVAELADLFIQAAEFYSKSTCEICGNEGSLVTENYWYRVRCTAHTDVTERSASDWPRVFRLIEAPQPTLDFSLLSPHGRIEKLSEEGPNNLRLSLVTYRSMENYIGARINDIQMVQEIGLFDSAPEAITVAKHYGCSVFYIQPCEKPIKRRCVSDAVTGGCVLRKRRPVN